MRVTFVDIDVVFVVIHKDGVGVGRGCQGLIMNYVVRQFLEFCFEKLEERTLFDVVLSQVAVEQPLAPQKGHVPNLIETKDQAIDHQGFHFRPV